jgi:hypothetical protein
LERIVNLGGSVFGKRPSLSNYATAVPVIQGPVLYMEIDCDDLIAQMMSIGVLLLLS